MSHKQFCIECNTEMYQPASSEAFCPNRDCASDAANLKRSQVIGNPSLSLQAAIGEYQARKARSSHPVGSFDKAGRWYPDGAEKQGCCERIRTPSRAWPNSLNSHCRSVDHIATLYRVNVSDLRKAINAVKKAAAKAA